MAVFGCEQSNSNNPTRCMWLTSCFKRIVIYPHGRSRCDVRNGRKHLLLWAHIVRESLFFVNKSFYTIKLGAEEDGVFRLELDVL